MEINEVLKMVLDGLAKNVVAPLGLILLAYIFNSLRPAIESINEWVNKRTEDIDNKSMYETILEAVKAVEKLSENKPMTSEEKRSEAYRLIEQAGLDPYNLNLDRKLESAVKDLDILEEKELEKEKVIEVKTNINKNPDIPDIDKEKLAKDIMKLIDQEIKLK